MALIVVDSDVVIDHLHSRPGQSSTLLEVAEEHELGIASVTLFEVERGLSSTTQCERFQRVLAAATFLPLDEAAARSAALIAYDLDRRGQKLDVADALIAGIVVSLGAKLLTRNRKHFTRVSGLELV